METAIAFLREHLGTVEPSKRQLIAAIQEEIPSIREAQAIIYGNVIASDDPRFETLHFDSDIVSSPVQLPDYPQDTYEDCLLPILRSCHPDGVIRRRYLNDYPNFIDWKNTYRCHDSILYGDFVMSVDQHLDNFVSSTDYIQIMALYPRNQPRCDFSSPYAVVITAFDDLGFLVFKVDKTS